MNKLQSSRSLLLEQLESRCMLASGVLTHSLHQDELDQYKRHEQRQVSDGRSQGFHRDQGGPRHEFSGPPSPNELGSALGELPQRVSVNVPDSAIPQANTPTPAIGAILPSDVESTRDIGTRDTSAADATVEVASLNNQIEFDGTSNTTGQTLLPETADIAATPSLNQSGSEADGGVIETLPQLRRELHSPATQDANDESWQLDSRSIERLREISRDAEMPSAVNPNESTDAVIASWFNGQTGLMEVKAAGKLQTPIDSFDSFVDVVLSATVGLHRSVDLIAIATSAPDTMPDDVRGAILAAIAAEQPSPLPEATTGPTSLRVSAITYPGAAIIATGITLAARRKLVGAKMEATWKRNL